MTPDIDMLAPPRDQRGAIGVSRRRRRSRGIPREAESSSGQAVGEPERHVCVSCGELARVHVLEGYADGQPSMRRFCLRCAPNASWVPAGHGFQRGRLRLYVLVGLVGLALGALALLGDWLIPARLTAGFGLHKQLGLAIGALLVLVGAVLRTELIMLGGVFVLGGSLVAGVFGLAHSPGTGWKEYTLLAVAFGCFVLAVLGRFGLAEYVRRTVRSLRSSSRANRRRAGG
jgi:hypothetical protein